MNLKKHTQTYKKNGIYETWSFIDLSESKEHQLDVDFFVVSPTGVTNYMTKSDAISLWKHNAMHYEARSTGLTNVGMDQVTKLEEKYQDQVTSMGSRA